MVRSLVSCTEMLDVVISLDKEIHPLPLSAPQSLPHNVVTDKELPGSSVKSGQCECKWTCLQVSV